MDATENAHGIFCGNKNPKRFARTERKLITKIIILEIRGGGTGIGMDKREARKEQTMTVISDRIFKNYFRDDFLTEFADSDIHDIVFKDVDFVDCDLSMLDFKKCVFINVTFVSCKVCKAAFRYCVFDTLAMRRCEGNLLLVYSIMKNISVYACLLQYSHFLDCMMNYCRFDGGSLNGVDFSCCDIVDCCFHRTNTDSITGLDTSSFRMVRGIRSDEIVTACPKEGSFIAWKKAVLHEATSADYGSVTVHGVHVPVIVKLMIPEDAKRSSATTRKCRCDKAIVLEIQDREGNRLNTTAHSMHDHNFLYEAGKVISVDNFDEDRFNECAPGIHFFVDRIDALRY